MPTPAQAYLDGVDAALMKFASRGREMARQWGAEAQNYTPGSPSHAKYLHLASRAGTAAFSPTSRPVDLGSIHPGGSEGPVRLNIQPQGGKSVATAIKTVPTYSQWHNDANLERRKAMAAGGLNQSEHFAKLYDARKLPTGEHQYTSEFVPGRTLHDLKTDQSTYLRTRIGAGRDVRRAGRNIGETNPMALHDARPNNIIMDANTGKPKIIDSFALTTHPRPGAQVAGAKPHEAETVRRYEADPVVDRAVMKTPNYMMPLTPAGQQLAAHPAQQYANPGTYKAMTRPEAQQQANADADWIEARRKRLAERT